MSRPTADTTDLSWLINRIVEVDERVVSALLFSADGLVLTHSGGLHRDIADSCSASLSGLRSLQITLSGMLLLAQGESVPPVRLTVVDQSDYTLAILPAGSRSGLAVAIRGALLSLEVPTVIANVQRTVEAVREVLETGGRRPVHPA